MCFEADRLASIASHWASRTSRAKWPRNIAYLNSKSTTTHCDQKLARDAIHCSTRSSSPPSAGPSK
eukprot:7046885-Alexandrium_andersonii.AAC.1